MRNRNDSQSAEFHGLSAADLLGATPSSQAKLATWRLMYTPGMYFNAASSGIMRWPGTFFVGGGVSKGMFQTLAEKTDRRWTGHEGDQYVLQGWHSRIQLKNGISQPKNGCDSTHG